MQRIASWVFFVTILSVLSAPRVLAHGPNDPPHQVFAMGDLKLESGETIKDFRISYVTHGTLNAKKSNAILMTASIAGNHHRIDFLIGPGRALDPTKYFIVATDAIGNGLTTSPSNSLTQHGTSFPRFDGRGRRSGTHGSRHRRVRRFGDGRAGDESDAQRLQPGRSKPEVRSCARRRRCVGSLGPQDLPPTFPIDGPPPRPGARALAPFPGL
jgi:hypothetical protein